jgi:hypothetical protein
MQEEARKLSRTELRMPVSPMLRWRGLSGEHDGCIKDVTLEGCFINTLGPAEVGELITFTAALPTDELVELRGRIVRQQYKPMGFGLRFEELTEPERTYLNRLIADGGGEKVG